MQKQPSTKKLMILIVEDHGSLCEMLSLYFMRYGYHVRTADNGETALEILSNEEIHLVLLDLMLPRLDGFAVLKELRESERVVPRISSSFLPGLRKEIATKFSAEKTTKKKKKQQKREREREVCVCEKKKIKKKKKKKRERERESEGVCKLCPVCSPDSGHGKEAKKNEAGDRPNLRCLPVYSQGID